VTLDVEVAERFRRGEDEAVRLVYREYGRLVYAVAFRVLGRRDLAEEATQQAFVQAWRAASSFNSTRPIGPWLATITRHVAIDIHRREARRAATALDDVPAGHGSLVTLPPSPDKLHDTWAVREAVDELPADEREVVRLQHLEGFSHSEIAERLGLPVGTVKSRSFRAHQRLAARLGYLRGDPP
jgi:RNA polymerase sigma-70 factor (ECF subfamily)